MKVLLFVIASVILQVNACSKTQESAQNKNDTPTEKRVILQRDLVERADEICKEEGDCEQALILYNQALEKDKDRAAEIYGKRAMAYYALKDFGKAISDFTAAIERKSDESARWYFMRGLTKSLLPVEDRTGSCKDFRSAKKRGFVSSNSPSNEKNFNGWVNEYCGTRDLSF